MTNRIKTVQQFRILNAPFSEVLEVATDLYGEKAAADIQFDPECETFGMTVFSPDHPIPLIHINANLKIMDAIEILAHEVAHVIAGEAAGHNSEWEEIFEAIHSGWIDRFRTKK